jgi:hypothetical protein
MNMDNIEKKLQFVTLENLKFMDRDGILMM